MGEERAWLPTNNLLRTMLACITLTGCGGGTQTVAGKVIDLNAQPYAGQTVVISSGTFKQSVVSDSNGAFSVSNVPTPYNATVFSIAGNFAIEYAGLTRADPTLTDVAFRTPDRQATVSGHLTGGTYPEPPGYDTFVLFASPETQYSLPENSGSFSSTVQWPGPATTTGNIYALQVHRFSEPLNPGLPMDYPGYGTANGVELQDQGTLDIQGMRLGAVATEQLSGALSLPAGYTSNGIAVGLSVASGVYLPVLEDFSGASSFTYNTPSISGTSLAIQASANATSGEYASLQKTGLAANASGVELALLAAPTLALPLDAATGIGTGTAFSWSTYAGGGIYLLFAYPQDESRPTFVVVTAVPRANIPDLASVGLPLPASTLYTWYVNALAPMASVDAIAAPGGINQFSAQDYTQGVTASRTFTTSPGQ